LFELPIANQPGKKRWVLIVNINPGGVASGSGGQYFIGNFDGKTFTNDNPADKALFVDYGADFYAGVTFSDAPAGRRILIGWMSNWQYAGKEPTEPFRTAQSIPRVLGLRQTAEGLRLAQKPVVELARLRMKPTVFGKISIGEYIVGSHKQVLFSGEAIEIVGEFVVRNASGALIELHSYEPTKKTMVGYDAKKQLVFIDRTESGLTDFDPLFAARHEAPLKLINGKLKLHIFVDRSSVEVFANDGVVTLTDRIFPIHDVKDVRTGQVYTSSRKQFITLWGFGTQAQCLSLKAWQLRSIWK
jgi:fructan beta-fructosidase